MYLARVYREYRKRADGAMRKLTLREILEWVCEEMDSERDEKWSKVVVIDCKHRTAILVWNRGVDGRPQLPVMPSQGKV